MKAHSFIPRRSESSVYDSERKRYVQVPSKVERCGLVTYYDWNAGAMDGTTHCDRLRADPIHSAATRCVRCFGDPSSFCCTGTEGR